MNQSQANSIHIAQNVAKEVAKKLSKMERVDQPTRTVRIDDNTEVMTRKLHLTDDQVRAEFKKIYKRPEFYFDEVGQQRIK